MNPRRDISAAEDLEKTAAAWVFRRDVGLSGEEAAEFERWLDADPRRRAAVVRQSRAWSALDRPRQTGQVDELVRRLATRAEVRRRRAVAIGMTFIALLVGGMIWRTQAPEAVEQRASRTAVILPERQTLADGSRVELRLGAEIAVEFSATLRRVVLKKGEAHFQVRKNERPFVVSAGNIEFRAVGTAFAVQIAKSEVELLVTEGHVAVEKAAAKAGGTAVPDTAPRATPTEILATVGPSNRMVVELELAAPILPPAVIPPLEVAERLAWRAPRLEFTDTPLAEAVTLMNRYNEKQFVIHDAELGKLQVSGLFRADRTESFVRLLEVNFGVRAETSGPEVGLRRQL